MTASTFILNPRHSLTLGELLLTDDWSSLMVQQRGWWVQPLAQGWSLGNPEPLLREIDTFLSDGALVASDGSGNRVMTVNLMLSANSSDLLVQAEMALRAQVEKRNTLTWTPPDLGPFGAGEPCAFDVVWSEMDLLDDIDDLTELRLKRYYALTVTALPYARSTRLNELTVAAPTNTVTTATLDPCDSTAGWSTSGTPNGSITPPTVVNSSVQVTGSRPANLAYFEFVLRRTFATPVNLNGRSFLRVEYAPDVRVPGAVYIDESKVEAAAAMGRVFWYPFPSSTLTSVAFADGTPFRPAATTQYPLGVADLTASTQPYDTTTATRQGIRRFDILGSVRTPASLRLSTTDAALGSTLIYVAPVGKQRVAPPLKTWKSTGEALTTDPSAISGTSNPIDQNGGTIFSIPADMVPDGGYQLLARLRRPAGAGQFSVTVSVGAGAANVPGNVYMDRVVNSSAGGSSWMPILPLGNYTLPVRRVGRSGRVLIRLFGSGMVLDELWLCSLDGSLIHVEPLAPDLFKHLWVDSPNVDNPVPQVLTGFTSDKTDAVDPAQTLVGCDPVTLYPGPCDIFFASATSSVTATTLWYYDRYHTHVPKAA